MGYLEPGRGKVLVRARRALDGRTILVVEDDYLVALDVAATLRREGAEVAGPVATAQEALDLIHRGPVPDTAVLDIKLSRGAVFEVAEALAAGKVPFVFATGYGRADLPDRFAGAPLIEKPFEAGALVRTLADLQDAKAPTT